jgi:hypothetical protein
LYCVRKNEVRTGVTAENSDVGTFPGPGFCLAHFNFG